MAQNFLKPITGCFGKPVAENPTQIMIEAAYNAMGLDWRYITLEVDAPDLAEAVAGARAMGVSRIQLHDPAQGRGHRTPQPSR